MCFFTTIHLSLEKSESGRFENLPFFKIVEISNFLQLFQKPVVFNSNDFAKLRTGITGRKSEVS